MCKELLGMHPTQTFSTPLHLFIVLAAVPIETSINITGFNLYNSLFQSSNVIYQSNGTKCWYPSSCAWLFQIYCQTVY